MRRLPPMIVVLSFLLAIPVLSCFDPLSFLETNSAAAAEATAVPQWIWLSNTPKENEIVHFRKSIEIKGKIKSAKLAVAADDQMILFINGSKVVEHHTWQQAAVEDVAEYLQTGNNVIAVRAKNGGSAAALLLKLTIETTDEKKQIIVTDPTWKAATKADGDWQRFKFDDSKWKTAHSFGKLGIGPWGAIAMNGELGAPLSTPVDAISVPEGFRVELLYSVPKGKQGSWVSMTSDTKGRLIVSDQYGGLYRVTPGKDIKTTKVEALKVEIGEAHGLLYEFDSLYVMVNGQAAQGSGLYRLRDTNGDDQFDEVKLLKKLQGGGEHGPHAIRLGPDGNLYVIAGNHTNLPDGLADSSPHQNWAEDLLLPRNPDGNGHATGRMAPAGWIARTDKDGKHWELFCAGFRNAYDFDFNQDGELFTYDADMEWDTGAPWYRPTRINHSVSAGEFGWRFGTGKWPDYFPDSLGSVVDIGLGSPTGINFGTGAKFPAKYQRALYINDWTYGKIYAVHMKPKGSGYTATFEKFIEAKPLPVTDVTVNIDGALYFTIGGRRTQSGLYRVTYVGKENTDPVGAIEDPAAARARNIRRQLESFHGRKDPQAIAVAWPYLNSSDRNLRYAARVAIEQQELGLWKEKALSETRSTASIHALLALTRTADKELQGQVVERLNNLPLKRLTEEQMVAALRTYGMAFIRLGKPDAKMKRQVSAKLSPFYPSQSQAINHELCRVLVYLEAPDVISRTMKLLKAAQTQQEQMYYAFALRNVSQGRALSQAWSHGERKAYFSWMNIAQKNYRGGHSFVKFVDQIRNDTLAKMSAQEKLALKEVIEGRQTVEVVKLETTRQFLHNWQIDDLKPMLAQVESGRSFEKGKAVYQAAQCYKCHRFAGDGGDTGPDITGVGNRFSPLYLLESLITPSSAVSDQYLNTMFITDDGETIVGRVIEENDKYVKVRIDPFALELTVLSKDSIEERQLSKISKMPQGLVNVLTQEEILDLIAYMRSAGKADDKAFRK